MVNDDYSYHNICNSSYCKIASSKKTACNINKDVSDTSHFSHQCSFLPDNSSHDCFSEHLFHGKYVIVNSAKECAVVIVYLRNNILCGHEWQRTFNDKAKDLFCYQEITLYMIKHMVNTIESKTTYNCYQAQESKARTGSL